MGASRRFPRSFIPDLPTTQKMVDKEGNILSEWRLFLDQLILGLQTNLKIEGFLLPKLTIAEINHIKSIYTPLVGGPLPVGIPDITGQTIFDVTNNVTKQFIITYDAATPPNIVIADWYTFCESNTGGCFLLLGP